MYLNLSSETRKTELQWHREPELVYVIEGTSECIRNGESKMVEEGDFILINSEDVHLVRPVSGTGCRLLCVNFSFEYIRDILKEIAATGSDGDYVSLLQISHINRIYYLLLSQCMCFRRSGGTVSATKRDFSYAKTAIAYINENYKREIPLNEISSVVNLSPSYFSKYFKNVTQVSFSKYLANLRLENAINDMIHHNSTVSTAAMENGFANVKAFITQCKKVYNCTPAQFKKRLSGRV